MYNSAREPHAVQMTTLHSLLLMTRREEGNTLAALTQMLINEF